MKPKAKPLSTATIARLRLAGKGASLPLTDLRKTVQQGLPKSFHKDLYFYLINGPWWLLLSAIAGTYLILNLFFASLYWIQPNSLAGSNGSFLNSFFFSVQTIATIGYGAMHPQTNLANILVTIESGLGLFGVALLAGILFAKFSKPTAGVLFSNVMVIQNRFGKPSLMFRVGNTRGNDVIDAHVTLTILIDEISPEGDHIRRIHDLKLQRNRTPFFALSWTVTHEIDEASPLYTIDFTDPNPPFISIVATLIAHDGTFNQTIHSRKFYTPDQIKYQYRFKDVIHQLETGQLMVDYAVFHEVESIN